MRRRGWTLAEVLVSLALMAAVLGVIANVFATAQRSLRFATEEVDRPGRELQTASTALAAELRQAVTDTVQPGTNQVRFKRVDPDFDPLLRLSPTAPSPLPSPTVVEVIWSLDAAGPEGALTRQEGATGRTRRVAECITQMAVEVYASDASVGFSMTARLADRKELTVMQVVRPRCVDVTRGGN